ncbi:MAG TPA: tetratricopeptide repeat protein [Alphaproteobacteria bacterium]|nr:tetratricopeptide repeat protein [Alphaproteobacteria bacterium]
MRRFSAVVVVLLALCAPLRAVADQTDARLGDLFERLKSTEQPQEAQLIEFVIWQIWSEANDPATDTLMGLGLQAMQGGNLAGALELFDAVTTRKPDFAEGWNKRATVLYLLGAYEESAKDVDKTLKLEPRHFGALSGLGLINMALERDEEAVAAFEAASKIHPHLPGVKANLETLKQRARKKGRAI